MNTTTFSYVDFTITNYGIFANLPTQNAFPRCVQWDTNSANPYLYHITKLDFNNNTISWCSDNALYQLNNLNFTYYYFALG